MRYAAKLMHAVSNEVSVRGMSNAGHVTISVSDRARILGRYVWHDGDMLSLNGEGFEQYRAMDVNANGIVCGGGHDKRGEHAYIWVDGAPKPLAGPRSERGSAGLSINDRGDIVGFCKSAHGHKTTGAALWRNGELTELVPDFGDPADYVQTFAWAITNSGLVLGKMLRGGIFVFDGSRYTQIDLASDDQWLDQGDLNDDRVVVGTWNWEDESVAFRWRDGKFDKLGMLDGSESMAFGINDRGAIVGESTFRLGSNDKHGFVYIGDRMHDLNDCTDNLDGWTIVSAVAINEAGQVAAKGSRGSESAALLLEPA